MNPLVVEATYENGVLKSTSPLPIKESVKVLVAVQVPDESEAVTGEEAERIVSRSYGMFGWTGDAETLRCIAEDPEFDWLEG